MTLFLSKQFSKTHRKTYLYLAVNLKRCKTIAVFLENLILQIFLQPFQWGYLNFSW